MQDSTSQTLDYILEKLKLSKRPYVFISDQTSFTKVPLEKPKNLVTPKVQKIKPTPKKEEAKLVSPSPKEVKAEKPKQPAHENTSSIKAEIDIQAPDVEIKPQKSSPIDEMKDIRALLTKKYPKVLIYDTPLNDSKARRIKNAWKDLLEIPKVALLYSNPNHREFFENIAKAISTVFVSSKAMHFPHFEEPENLSRFLGDTNLKLIVSPDDVIMGSKALMEQYKELPQQKQRFLGKVPLILLPDLSLYFKDPKLKASLWRLLCQYLVSQMN